MHNPMVVPLWAIPLKRDWFKYGEGYIPVIEHNGGALVLLIPYHRYNYRPKLATAREVVQAHNKAVKAARKACYDRKTQTSDR